MSIEELINGWNEKLKAINPLVTAKDKYAAMEELNIHYATVHRYLNGGVKKVDTASDLLEFFNKRIENRNKVLNTENVA